MALKSGSSVTGNDSTQTNAAQQALQVCIFSYFFHIDQLKNPVDFLNIKLDLIHTDSNFFFFILKFFFWSEIGCEHLHNANSENIKSKPWYICLALKKLR